MNRPLLGDAFGHHAWATLLLIDACRTLSTEQLETAVPGTYGSILETMQHLVGADSWYLFDISGDQGLDIEADAMTLDELRTAAERTGERWARLLEQDLDPDLVIHEVDESDGFKRDATLGIRLAQALHHASDHRSQICTALTSHGVDPPGIDVWDYGLTDGRVVRTAPTI